MLFFHLKLSRASHSTPPSPAPFPVPSSCPGLLFLTKQFSPTSGVLHLRFPLPRMPFSPSLQGSPIFSLPESPVNGHLLREPFLTRYLEASPLTKSLSFYYPHLIFFITLNNWNYIIYFILSYFPLTMKSTRAGSCVLPIGVSLLPRTAFGIHEMLNKYLLGWTNKWM